MKIFYQYRLILLIIVLAGCNWIASAQTTSTFVFITGGAVQTFLVPAGANSIGINAIGAKGGNYPSESTGGAGGHVQCTLNVTPGTLYIYVGGAGSNGGTGSVPPGGANAGGEAGGSGSNSDGGAAGGAASDVRTIPYTAGAGVSLSSRLVVAAGGGGGGYDCSNETGGAGGGATGGNGIWCSGSDGATVNGATQTGGGVGQNTTGTFGAGGNAGSSALGGGGGGGWWGGGGANDGGGGGGSSFPIAIGGNVTAVVNAAGYNAAGTINTAGNGQVTITVLCGSPGAIVGSSAVCTGVTTQYTDPLGATGGTWSSNNPGVATVNLNSGAVTGLLPGVATITYNVPNPCGGVAALATQNITVNLSPTITTAVSALCTGVSTFITGSPTSGAWSSSNTAIASVTALGTITGGLSAGSATITYTTSATGCFAINPLVINLSPNTNNVTGGGGYCAGATSNVHVGLSGSQTGVNYSLINGGTTASTLPGTNGALDFGVLSVPGAYTVVGIGPGCSVTQAGVANVSINANPSAITGQAAVCTGATGLLSSTPTGGTWASNNISLATIDPSSGVVTGVSAGSLTVTYTLTGGCNITAPVTVHTTPLPISGQTTVCSGSISTLSSLTTGGTWISSNTSLAAIGIGNGIASALSAGTATVTYTLPSGCFTTTPFSVNLLPVTYPVTGGGGYCNGAGVHIGLSYSNTGFNYQLYNGAALVSTVAGSNSGLDFGVQYTPGNYTVFAVNTVTNCSVTMPNSIVVTSNASPNTTYVVGGGGGYCAGGTGSDITLNNSDINTSYQLINGGPTGPAVAGTGARLDFGLQTAAGSYTVMATTNAGCTGNEAGSAAVTIEPAPAAYTLSAGGSYCAGGTGVDITLTGSDLSAKYQLMNSGANVGAPVTGTGSSIDFGLKTAAGNYTVIATSTATSCTSNMTGSPAITINPSPAAYTVTGGGSYCSGSEGVNVGLSFSDPGFTYQLYNSGTAVGTSLPGSSSGLTFGAITAPGSYTIAATNTLTGCMSNMSGSAAVTVKPAPAPYPVTGGGTFCTGSTGAAVGLGGSATGIQYQLYNNGAIVGTAVAGTGSSLSFGLHTAPGNYTIVATNSTAGCTTAMPGAAIVTASALPALYNIGTAGTGASYCAGSAGVDILLSGSDIGTGYQLYRGILPVGSSKAGTGAALDFGSNTLPGVYTIVADNAVTTCTNNMSGSESVTAVPVPNVYTVTGGGNYCSGGTGVHVALTGSNTGISYQLYNSISGAAGVAVSGTGGAVDFGIQSAPGNYTVIATNTSTLCTSNMSGSPAITVSSVPDAYTLLGDGGSYCSGSAGAAVGLSGSAAGIRYQLYNGTAATGAAVSGTGSAITFGPHAAGTYTVLATNNTTGCTSNMPGTATIAVNSLPAAYPVSGGGNVCSAGPGAAITLGNSDIGVNYELYYAGNPTGTVVSGTGGILSLGVQTGGGIYTATAMNSSTFCTNNMTGNAAIVVTPSPAVQTVTGGGNYCSGGSGVHIGLDGSGTGFSYQLYNGGSPVGGLVAGTGVAVDFGEQTGSGVYTVVASPGGLCQAAMAASVTVSVDPLPAVDTITVTNGGRYCTGGTGVTIGLNTSASGISYQLYYGSTAAGTPINGTAGLSVSFGSQTLSGVYSVIATNPATGCTNSMAGSGSVMVSINPLPNVYAVTGGGNYCTGGEGVHVELSESNTDINYQLLVNGAAAGSPLAGTGTELDFGFKTAAGNYSVVATDAYSHCSDTMSGIAAVAVNTYLVPDFTVTANPGTSITRGEAETLTANTNAATAGTSPAYQWYINGLPVSGATNSTYTSQSFNNNDSVSCVVTSSGLCGGVSRSEGVKITVSSATGVQQVTASGSNIALIPNPNKGVFTIKGTLGTNNDEEVSLEITDMVGHVVYTDKVTANNGNINAKIQLSNILANGMYILSLHSAAGNNIFHMVIEQ